MPSGPHRPDPGLPLPGPAAPRLAAYGVLQQELINAREKAGW